jgi:hypothetical protein
MEWNGPLGEIEECGGDVLFRSPVFLELGGFNPGMIAGEEPELCVRVRGAGYKILRIDAEMTLHDAAMTRFAQWWTRSVRGGHSYAEGMALHGAGFSRHNVRRTLSALAYGLGLPALWFGTLFFSALGIGVGLSPFGAFTPLGFGLGLGVFVLVPAAFLRAAFGAYRDRRRRGDPARFAALYAGFCVLGKLPEAIGVLTYWSNRLRGRYSGLMEYKGAASAAPAEPKGSAPERRGPSVSQAAFAGAGMAQPAVNGVTAKGSAPC